MFHCQRHVCMKRVKQDGQNVYFNHLLSTADTLNCFMFISWLFSEAKRTDSDVSCSIR